MSCFIIYSDGACSPKNPGGHMGLGVAIHCFNDYIPSEAQIPDKRIELAKYAGQVNSSNIKAEWMAFLEGLKWALKNTVSNDHIFFKLDCEFVTKVMDGEYSMRPNKRYTEAAKESISIFNAINAKKHIIWIRRDRNIEADALSKKAIEQYLKPKTKFRQL